MPAISIFDILKIGIGPSSSHTMGPWKAALAFLEKPLVKAQLKNTKKIQITLYGSLAKTGTGHGTDMAILLGLSGQNPETIAARTLTRTLQRIKTTKTIQLLNQYQIPFDPDTDIIFNTKKTKLEHPNTLTFTLTTNNNTTILATYYSIGGGFIKEADIPKKQSSIELPYPIDTAKQLLNHSARKKCPISDIVWQNELTWQTRTRINTQLDKIARTMCQSVYRGCYKMGILPGGLGVKRRAPRLNYQLLDHQKKLTYRQWLTALQTNEYNFEQMLSWVCCFALAVSEENASFGRIVTAPTNGSAGVIPSILMYLIAFRKISPIQLRRFLLTAGELASIIKKQATISGAVGGCQAEIGVASAMAAGALTEILGGKPKSVMMAAEIALEHHLGLTCDPVAGLVQIPCIERNSMGAVKAITAAQIALSSNPERAKISFDTVIQAMHATAEDMNKKYKETAEGGLAALVATNRTVC